MDSKAKLPMDDRLTTSDLKYRNSISLVIRSDRAEALADGSGVLDGNKDLGNKVGTATMSDVGIGLLAIFATI